MSRVTTAPLGPTANGSPVNTNSTVANPSKPFSPLNTQVLPQAIRQSFCDRMTALRIYSQLLQEEISKILAMDHSDTPDLIVSEIAEMKSIHDSLEVRDSKIASILDSSMSQ